MKRQLQHQVTGLRVDVIEETTDTVTIKSGKVVTTIQRREIANGKWRFV